MYRRLANAAGNAAHALQHVSDVLQRRADDAARTSRRSGAEAKPLFSASSSSLTSHSSFHEQLGDSRDGTRPTTAAPSQDPQKGYVPSSAAIQRVCDVLKNVGLSSWLPLSDSNDSVERYTHHWLSSAWFPPASQSAYHSLTYSVGPSSVLLSNMEKSLTNTVAQRLRLPCRFLWPASAEPKQCTASGRHEEVLQFLSSKVSATTPAAESRRSTAPASATTMLWPTAMRTTTGATVPRPPSPSTSAVALTAPLTTLTSVATARHVFAPVASKSLSPASSLVSAPSAPESLVGGGVLFSSRLEAYMVLLLTARTQALTRSASQHNAFSGQEDAARQLNKLVLYASDQVDPLLLRAAQLVGVPHLRVLQTVAADRVLPVPSGAAKDNDVLHHYNYTVDVSRLQARLVEDAAAGLYPMMVVGTFGSALSGAVDPLAALGSFCQKLGVWYHIDASEGGAALLACTHDTEHPLFPSASATAPPRWSAVAGEFHRASLMADSLLFSAGCTALPYSVLSGYFAADGGCSGAGAAALLFVAHTRKVAWAVHSLGESSRQSTFNQHLTPSISDSDVVRISPLAHSCGWLVSQTIAAALCRETRAEESSSSMLMKSHAVSTIQPGVSSTLSGPASQPHAAANVALRVAQHQEFVADVQRAVRSDGRFDASLDASLFGVVYLRWLTAADEATNELARAWADEVSSALCEAALACPDGDLCPSSGARDTPSVKLYIGIVQLQRRLWVRLSFGQLPETAGNESRCDDTREHSQERDHSSPPLQDRVNYVLCTLDRAARRVKPASLHSEAVSSARRASTTTTTHHNHIGGASFTAP
jgi:hypothetical protein